jgi:hypothetical protein
MRSESIQRREDTHEHRIFGALLPATAPPGAAASLVGYMRTGITLAVAGTGRAIPGATATGAVTPGTGYGRPSGWMGTM